MSGVASPNMFGMPGCAAKSSISSLSMKPAPRPVLIALEIGVPIALLTAYAGAVCRNARHEAGRTLADIVVNEAQAKAHPDGSKLIERLDAAIAGTNTEPIHVSTGLLCKTVKANGESRGKPYDQIAVDIEYDHLAFLLNDRKAGPMAIRNSRYVPRMM